VRIRPRLAPRQFCNDLWSKGIDPHWSGNVLERSFSTIFERVSKLGTYVLVHRSGHADAAGIRQRFEAAGNVDPVTMNILVNRQDVTKVDADAQVNALPIRVGGVPLSHRLLQRDGAGYGLHRTRELHQDAIAFDPDDPARVLPNLRPHDVAQYILQTPPRTDLVLSSEAAIAHHVGKQDSLYSALHALLRHDGPRGSTPRLQLALYSSTICEFENSTPAPTLCSPLRTNT